MHQNPIRAAVEVGDLPTSASLHSTKVDLQDVVRKPEDVGSTDNFSTCLQRFLEQGVHLLHGGELVMPESYNKL
jgi:hypothetical protein